MAIHVTTHSRSEENCSLSEQESFGSFTEPQCAACYKPSRSQHDSVFFVAFRFMVHRYRCLVIRRFSQFSDQAKDLVQDGLDMKVLAAAGTRAKGRYRARLIKADVTELSSEAVIQVSFDQFCDSA